MFFSHRVTLPNMSPTLISGVRGVTCYDDALATMGVFFARTGPRNSGDFIIAAVVADIHDFWECTNCFYCPRRPAGNARGARRGKPAAPGGEPGLVANYKQTRSKLVANPSRKPSNKPNALDLGRIS